MAADDWIGTGGTWDDHFNWDTNTVPNSSDDVVIDETAPNAGAPYIYSGYAAVANSVTIGPDQTDLGIGFGGSLTVTAEVTLGVDSSIGLSGGGGGALIVGADLFDNGVLDATVGTVTVDAEIDVSATGEIVADGGTVSAATLVNSGIHQSGDPTGNNDGVYVDEAAASSSGTLDVTGRFTNSGSFGVGDFGGANRVTIGVLDNKAAGQIDIGTVTMTVTNLTNAGVAVGSTPGGIGVDRRSYQSGGEVTVTGTFSNTGDFGVGNGVATPMVTVGKFVNSATGVVDIESGEVKTVTLANAAVATATTTTGLGVDAYAGEVGSGDLTVTGAFTNTGDFGVGNGTATPTTNIGTLDNTAGAKIRIASGTVNVGTLANLPASSNPKAASGLIFVQPSGSAAANLNVAGAFTNSGSLNIGDSAMTAAATVTVATLTSDNGVVEVFGGKTAQATLALASTPSDWAIPISIAGDALLEMKDNGQIRTIEQGSDIQIQGSDAFVADADDPTTNSALEHLNLIYGTLDLIQGAVVTVAGDVTVAGALGQIELDDIANLGGSQLTVKGTLNDDNHVQVGQKGNTGSTAVTLGGLVVGVGGLFDVEDAVATVNGNVENDADGRSTIYSDRAALDVDHDSGTDGGVLKVTGVFANRGVLNIGNGASRKTKATIDTLTNLSGALVNIASGAVTVKTLTNAAGGKSGTGFDVYSFVASSDINLTVTGVLSNTGDFDVGNIVASPTVTIATLDNASAGKFDISSGKTTIATLNNDATTYIGALDGDPGVTIDKLSNQSDGFFSVVNGDVTVGALTNEAGPTKGDGLRGVDVDATFSSSFATILTVKGAFTNRGLLDVTSGTKGIAKVVVGKLDNADGTIEISQSGFVDVESSSTSWSGALSIDASYMTYLDGGKVETIAKGGSIKLVGADAGIYDAGTQSGGAANALSALATIDGSLELDNGAYLKVDGDLNNNGVGAGGIGVDDSAGGGSYLDVAGKLTNNGSAYIGYSSATAYSYLRVGALDNTAAGILGIYGAGVDVYGDLTNSAKGAGIYVYGSSALAGELRIKGVATNSGTMKVGYDGANAHLVDVDADAFMNSGMVDINASSPSAFGTLDVTGTYTQESGAPGLTNVQGTLTATSIVVKGGTIDGDGMIVGAVDNIGGDLQAGETLASPGKLTIGGPSLSGSYSQSKGGTLTEIVAGAGQFGEIVVSGAVALAGALRVETESGFKFKKGESFEVMSLAAHKLKGTFSSVIDGSHKANGSEVDIGGGLALKVIYDNASGQIDLDVVATPTARGTSGRDAFAYEASDAYTAGIFDSTPFVGALSAPAIAAEALGFGNRDSAAGS